MVRRELTEAEWLRRAIRHCEFWGMERPYAASQRACAIAESPRGWWRGLNRQRGASRFDIFAGWLPENLMFVSLSNLRARLAALEGKAA